MALNNQKAKGKEVEAGVEEVVAPAKATGAKGVSKSNELKAKGEALISALSEEERNQLGADAGTLHFVHLLGTESRKTPRKMNDQKSVDWASPIGVRFKTDKDIVVPVIDITKDNTTGIETSDIGEKHVKAGEEFDLTLYEAMFLLIRDEYAGFFEFKGDVNGGYFQPKMSKYLSGDTKLPTPTLVSKPGLGSIKENIVPIDEKDPSGAWVVKPEYQEKFGAALKKATPRRSAGKKTKTAAPTAVAKALNDLLLRK